MTAIYRSARRDEIPTLAGIFLTGLADFLKSHGIPPASYAQADVERLYEHLFDTGIFEVAELDGKVVGFAAGISRDELWFLSMFWFLPEHKLHGYGRPLIEHVWLIARSRGATTFATWSSIDFTAVSAYLRLDLMPAGPIFTFAGPVLRVPIATEDVVVSPLDPVQASGIDHIVRGTPRSPDHAFWQKRGVPGFLLEIAGRTAGYFYVENGNIGPAAWLDEADGPALVTSAILKAREQAPQIKLIALGLNQTALRAATAAGLKLISAAHFMRSESFGRLEQYLPSGPGLF
ncbi:MAG TPA: GNAT family N-acetyltransferase [Polyangiaceae bacterium]